MKLKLFTLMTALLVTVLSVKAQDEPKNSGISEFDDFKKSAYALRGSTKDIKQTITDIDTEVKNLTDKDKQSDLSKIDGYINNLMSSKEAVAKLGTQAASLTTTGADLVKKAPKAKPIMKAKAATTNTKKSVEQVDKSKEDLESSKQMIEDNLKILKELKGE